jgi:hypothetical protein
MLVYNIELDITPNNSRKPNLFDWLWPNQQTGNVLNSTPCLQPYSGFTTQLIVNNPTPPLVTMATAG